MLETEHDLVVLQTVLDASYAGASEHLRSIIRDDRSLRAGEIAALMTGMRTLSLATVTSRSEPRVSAVDGHFLHGAWVFTTSATSPKVRQLTARPAVSAAHLEGESLAVFTHGDAHRITENDPWYDETLHHLTDHYDSSPLSWGDTAMYRLRPAWMVGYASDRARVLAAHGVDVEPRV